MDVQFKSKVLVDLYSQCIPYETDPSGSKYLQFPAPQFGYNALHNYFITNIWMRIFFLMLICCFIITKINASPQQVEQHLELFFAISAFFLAITTAEGCCRTKFSACYKIHPSADIHIIIHGYVYGNASVVLQSLTFWFTK